MKKRKNSRSTKKITKARPAINKNALTIIPRRLLPGTVTATSWTPPVHMMFEQWKAAGRALCQFHGAVCWLLGDWWRSGHKYGERAKAVRDGEFGDYSFGTLANYGWVAGRIKPSVRREVLSFQHHVVVAPLTPAQQRHWLDRAESEKLSAAAMQDLIAAAQSAQIDQDLGGSPDACDADNTGSPPIWGITPP
jgi:hypothetical protein